MTDDEKQRAQIAAEVFEEAAGAPPEPEKTPEPAPEVKEAPPEPDEWAGIAPALRAKFETMQTSLGELGTVKERLQQAERRVGALTNELRDAKKTPEPVKDPVESESRKKFREDYPELHKPIDELVADVRADILAKMPQIDEKGLTEAIRAQVKTEIAFDLAVERVEEKHPGWQAQKETPEFKAWHDKAPADIPKVAYTAVEAIKLMDAWKAHQKNQKSPATIEAERLKRLEQAQSPEGRKLPVAKAESDMTEAELRAHIAAQVFAKG